MSVGTWIVVVVAAGLIAGGMLFYIMEDKR